MELTEKERLVMQGIIDSEYNGDGPTGSAAIWSWSIRCDLPKRSLGGVVASLVKKGYAVATEGETHGEDTVYLTDTGLAKLRQ